LEDLLNLETPGRILLVEDDCDVRQLIGDELVRLGYHVVGVSSLGECRRELHEGSDAPDLVLLDRYLPDGDGCEVIRGLQSGNSLPRIPVIVISVDRSAEGISEALAAGAVDYLVKPFEGKVLAARLGAALRDARQKQTLLKTQQVLARTKRELELIFDAVDESILLVDAEMLVRRINRAGMMVSGKPSFDQVLGQPCHQVIYGSSDPCPGCPAVAAFRDRGYMEAEVDHQTGGRRAKHLHRAHFLERADSGEEMAVVITEDVTEKRDIEKEKVRVEKLEAVMRLAGGLAHEISQPLAAVSGRAELLEMALEACEGGEGGLELQRHVENLRSNSRRLSDIVRRLQNISDYITKPYYGGAEILDLTLSSGKPDAEEGADRVGTAGKGA